MASNEVRHKRSDDLSDNKTRVESIAKTLDDIAQGRAILAGGDIKTWDELTDDERRAYEENRDIGDKDQPRDASMFDYLADNCGIWYLLDSYKELVHGRVCMAFGGPNIYIDTDTGKVVLYWCLVRAEASMTDAAVEAVDEFLDDMYHR